MPTAAKARNRNGSGSVPKATPAPAQSEADIRGFEIPRPVMKQATLHLRGISPLIMHRWSEKARKQLEDAQTGRARAQKSARQPEEEAYAAAYIVPGREGWDNGKTGKFYFPAPAFKHAFLYGVSQLDDIKRFPKTKATGWVFVDADPTITADSIRMREDTGRIGQGTTTMVYRLQFDGWSTDLDITYNANTITVEQIVALFDLGGSGGVGEWRPTSPKNKSGDYGRFVVSGITERR